MSMFHNRNRKKKAYMPEKIIEKQKIIKVPDFV